MEKKVEVFQNRGMTRDISISKANKDLTYENFNIRITARDNDTLLSVTNEKGTSPITIYKEKILNAQNSSVEITDEILEISGTLIGYAVLNAYLVLFMKDENGDSIYRLNYHKDVSDKPWSGLILVDHQNLDFSVSHPIETVVYYESELIQKVYWTDGVNQPRFINIMSDPSDIDIDQLNFVSSIGTDIECTITREDLGTGTFPAGVIQYFVTYFNRYGQETNVVYRSPLYNLSAADKGTAADSSCTCSFTLKLENLDVAYDYVKIYSIIRTSYNGTAVANVVGVFNIVDDTVEVVDTGSYTETVDPTSLLYKGGRSITAETISHKDNTLFLGGLRITDTIIDKDLDETINKERLEMSKPENERDPGYARTLEFVYNSDPSIEGGTEYYIPYYSAGQVYPYNSQLGLPSSVIRTFKGGNKYRIGIVFTTPTGVSTQVYWLGDIKNNLYPVYENQRYKRAIVRYIPSSAVYNKIKEKGYSYCTLYMAEVTAQDRLVKAQGVLSPVMFQLKERCANSPYAESSWCFRPIGGLKANLHLDCVIPISNEITWNEAESTYGATLSETFLPNIGAEMSHIMESVTPYQQFTYSEDTMYTGVRYYIKCHVIKNHAKWGKFEVYYRYVKPDGSLTETFMQANSKNWNDESACLDEIISICENVIHMVIPAGFREGLDVMRDQTWRQADRYWYIGSDSGGYKTYPPASESEWFTTGYTNTTAYEKELFKVKYGGYYFVDGTIATMNSPELQFDEISTVDSYKMRVVGVIDITGNASAYHIDVEPDSKGQSITSSWNFSTNTNSMEPNGLCASPMVQTDAAEGRSTVMWTYPWHKSGSMSNMEEDRSKLNSKVYSNLYYSYYTRYLLTEDLENKEKNPGTDYKRLPWEHSVNIRIIEDNKDSLYTFEQNDKTILYQGDYHSLVTTASSARYCTLDTSTSDFSVPQESLERIGTVHANKLQDPVEIGFRSARHFLIANNAENVEGSLVPVEFPQLYTSDTGEDTFSNESNSFEGTLVWEEGTTGKYSVKNIVTYSDQSYIIPFISSDNNVYIFEDDWDWWSGIKDSLAQNVYYMVLEQDDHYIFKRITEIQEVGDLEDPIIDNENTYINLSTRTFYYKATLPDQASEYTISLKNPATDREIYSYTGDASSTEISGSTVIEDIQDISYVFTVIARDDFNQSSSAQATVRTEGVISPSLEVSVSSIEVNCDEQTSKFKITSNIPWELVITDASEVSRTASRISQKKIAIKTESSSTTQGTYLLYDVRFNQIFLYDDGTIGAAPVDSGSSLSPQYFLKGTSFDYPYLLLAELYVEDNGQLYGGDSNYALEANTFIPIGQQTSIKTLGLGDSIIGTEGDAYFQRWDCLKTYAYSDDLENSNIEMLSFMVETYHNIDGRTDSLRGLIDNTAMTPERINTVNNVYSQPNNFTTGIVFNSSKKTENNWFPAQFTWTSTKIPTADVDAWTNITLANTYDLDGDKGPLRAIRRFQNSLITFQDKGISEILYNTRTQITSTQGVPIEIANSAKVDGVRYLADRAGCVNKWSIVQTSKGIYFIDNINSSISIYTGSIQSLSDSLGFKDWIGLNNSLDIWNPESYTNFVGFWDRVNDDVYFLRVNEDNPEQSVICYNEQLGQFTSFFNYGEVPMLVNVEDQFVAYKGGLWSMHTGKYSRIFGEYQPFHVTYRIAPEPYSDKIFSSIEYRADMFSGTPYNPDENPPTGDTFDTVRVWNEYQDTGVVDLKFNPFKDRYPDKRQKFRIWRMDIPRNRKKTDNNPYGLDRIRNPWIWLRLEKTPSQGSDELMVMHDLMTYYYV